MNKLKTLSAIVFAAVTLTSCGGGNGDQSGQDKNLQGSIGIDALQNDMAELNVWACLARRSRQCLCRNEELIATMIGGE